jgi:uroporphyrinogen-III synthase
MRPLEGRRIALLESRRSSEMALLVERLGGTPLSVPSVREVLRDDDFGPTLERLVAGDFDLVVVLTAAACEALFVEAQRRGQLAAVTDSMGRATIACRGPKPLLVLRRHGLVPQVVTAKPHTTAELLDALDATSLVRRRVLLLHYGERSDVVPAALVRQGAQVTELSLYDWALPEDLAPLQALVRDTIAGRVDAMLFTSQVQLRHLLSAATAIRDDAELTRALRDDVIVGSIGPVCTRALRDVGIVPDVMPRSPNGASLVQAIADYLSMFTRTEETAS